MNDQIKQLQDKYCQYCPRIEGCFYCPHDIPKMIKLREEEEKSNEKARAWEELRDNLLRPLL